MSGGPMTGSSPERPKSYCGRILPCGCVDDLIEHTRLALCVRHREAYTYLKGRYDRQNMPLPAAVSVLELLNIVAEMQDDLRERGERG